MSDDGNHHVREYIKARIAKLETPMSLATQGPGDLRLPNLQIAKLETPMSLAKLIRRLEELASVVGGDQPVVLRAAHQRSCCVYIHTQSAAAKLLRELLQRLDD
jgi:hypothetical protein